MPDGFDAPRIPGVIDAPPSTRRDLKKTTAVRVTEIVMAPLTLLVIGSLVLVGMVVWVGWIVGCRVIRPLLYTVAGVAVGALVLMTGGVMGYAYHAYQLANSRQSGAAGLAEPPLAAPDLPPLSALPPPIQAPAQATPQLPQIDPFGLKR